MKNIYILLTSFCILNALDYFTTMQAISNGAGEGNPLANFFIANDALHFMKIGGLSLLCIYLIVRAKLSPKSQPRITKVLVGINVVYILLVVSNILMNQVQLRQ